MTQWLMVLITVVIGMAIALQPVVNRELFKYVNHPLQAALISFSSGTALLILLCTWLYFFKGTASPLSAELSKGPWWMWLGGTLGVFFITASIYMVEPLGPTTMLMCFIAGQLIASIVLEHFGLLNTTVRPITAQRLFAVLLMAVAIVLITTPGWKLWFSKP
jgi:bacterial/archaeal transporter family-2 protein